MSMTLKFVDPTEQNTLACERRTTSRYVLTGRVTAVRHTDADRITGKRICSLELMNISDSGLGALCQDPIDLESRITIFFPPHGPERGFDLSGRVVRCNARERGHELGIRFDSRHAA